MSPARALRRRLVPAALLPALALALGACAHRAQGPGYFAPTAAQIGPYFNTYGEAVLPKGGTIVVQGDDFAYGLARGRSRHRINGAEEGQASDTISQAIRKVVKGVKVENRGFPGDTVADSARRWAGRSPGDLLILSFGEGDRVVHSSAADFYAPMDALIRNAHAHGAAVFVVLPPPSADPLVNADINLYRSYAAASATANGAEVFDASAAMARIKSPPIKTIAQRAAVYQAVAADMVPYIKVVAAPAPQTGQAGSADSRTVRAEPDSAS